MKKPSKRRMNFYLFSSICRSSLLRNVSTISRILLHCQRVHSSLLFSICVFIKRVLSLFSSAYPSIYRRILPMVSLLIRWDGNPSFIHIYIYEENKVSYFSYLSGQIEVLAARNETWGGHFFLSLLTDIKNIVSHAIHYVTRPGFEIY
jgi:hypothetical protein